MGKARGIVGIIEDNFLAVSELNSNYFPHVWLYSLPL